MKVSSVCTRDVVTIDARCTIHEAARLMRDRHVGSLVVTRQTPDGVTVFGVVTDRDLVVDVLARDPAIECFHLVVADVAQCEIALVSEDADLEDALEAMQASGVRRLLVSDGCHRLSGLVSMDDLLTVCAEQLASIRRVVQCGQFREASSDDDPDLPRRSLPYMPPIGSLTWARLAL